jgi:hypothetical protein
MIETLFVASSPFVLNAVMSVTKWLTSVQTTVGKRFLLALLSIVGAVTFSALMGTPLDSNSISSLLSIAFESLVAFLAAHGSYHLFWSEPLFKPEDLER